MAAPDPYRILRLPRDATPLQIESAYHRLAKQYHPDRNKSPDANARMAEINWAYELLSDPQRRREYDRAHPRPAPPPPPRPDPPPVGETGLRSRRPVSRRRAKGRVGRLLSSLFDEPLAHPWILLGLGVLLGYLIYSRFPSSIEPPRNPGDLAFTGALTAVADYLRAERLTASPPPASLPAAAVGTPIPPNALARGCVLALSAGRYAGETVCVYGRINRIDHTADAYSIHFIESGENLVARSTTQSWPELNVRECIVAKGVLRTEAEGLVLEILPDGLGRCP